ncbi:MAG: metal ABC transporter substrate-binding protein, partial [Paracoccaceae bacterium]|nr:metal ABC transporter substrate-binding protein [Paracoccaceae bacterium]
MKPILATLIAVIAGSSFANANENTQIMTDILPVQSLVQMVAGEQAEIGVLMGPDADPHHFQMRPSQVRALGQAGAVIFVGDALTPWLAEKAGGLAPDATLLALMEIEGNHAHTDEHGADPHAWLDIDNAILWVGSIAETLGQRDPANAALYQANAGA